jgi:release factor glutamine methyltransferase
MKEFWGLPLRIDSSVLVPRPDTETVVETALAAIDARGLRTQPWRIADLGTGSGALLLALLHELPQASGAGVDRDVRTVTIARDNALRLGIGTRAVFAVSDYGAALAGAFDLVVANPPYVATRDIAALAPEVRDYDPRLALDGGEDGLDAYRAIAADAARLIAPGGSLVVEIGVGQSCAVATMLGAAGFDTSMRADLSGIPRAVRGRRRR